MQWGEFKRFSWNFKKSEEALVQGSVQSLSGKVDAMCVGSLELALMRWLKEPAI